MARFKNIHAKNQSPNPIITGNANQNRNTIKISPTKKKQAAIPTYSNFLSVLIISGITSYLIYKKYKW